MKKLILFLILALLPGLSFAGSHSVSIVRGQSGGGPIYILLYDADNPSGTNYAYLNSGASSIAGTLTGASISTAHPVSGNGLLYDAPNEYLTFTTGVTGIDTSEGSTEIWVYVDAAAITGENPLFELYNTSILGTDNIVRANITATGAVYLRHEGANVPVAMTTTATISPQTLTRLRFRWSVASNIIGVQVGEAGSWENDADGDAVTALAAAVDKVHLGDGVYNFTITNPVYADNFSIMSGYDTFNN